jgi:hypothetical protein
MYDELLKSLEDAQLLDLAKYVLAEASKRKLEGEFRDLGLKQETIERVRREAYTSEVNKQQQIQLDKIAEEARKQAESDVAASMGKKAPDDTKSEALVNWEKKLAIKNALLWLGIESSDYWSIAVWTRAADRRIYLNDENEKSLCEYYHTGNSKHPPGKLVCTVKMDSLMPEGQKFTANHRKQIKALFAEICKRWDTVSFNVNEIDDFEGTANEQHLQVYIKAMELAKS